MPQFTDEQIRQRLAQVDPALLTGTTTNKLLSVYRQTGLTWKEVLSYFARKGYRWEDAAKFCNIKRTTLQAYCYRQNLRFPFSGQKHPDTLNARLQDRAKHPEKYQREYDCRQYTIYGVTASLSQLVQQFGHNSVQYCHVNERISPRMGWTLEEALTTPVGQRRSKPQSEKQAA